MRNFVKNVDKKCRQKIICEYFDESTNNQVNSENCCDIGCLEMPANVKSSDGICRSTSFSRIVDDDDKKLRETLKLIPENRNKASVFGTNNLNNLTDALINDLCKLASYIFTAQYLMENFAIFDSWLAHEVLTVFNEVFEDIMGVSYRSLRT